MVVSREDFDVIEVALKNVRANGVKEGYFADSTMYSVQHALEITKRLAAIDGGAK